ncbi:MAG: chorismate lyase [Gammaproteobacteria bacterium]|nr:chorismate lyase [Gammaproteobacteria bacterium]
MTPLWFNPQHFLFRQCSPLLRDSLTCEGSLTEYISGYCAGGLELKIKNEKWQRPVTGELPGYGRIGKRQLYIREITLNCGDARFIYGRSLFSRRSYRYCRRQLERLGDRPLGEWLFGDRRIQRMHTQIGRIPKLSRLYRLAIPGETVRPAKLWGRRSLYSVNGHPLLVIEIFLPSLIKCIQYSKKVNPS